MPNFKIYYERISNCYIKKLPNRIGVYVVVHTTDNVHVEKYVGVTTNFYSRMYDHFDKGIMYIDMFVTSDIELAKSLERIFIYLIKPATNKKIPHLSDDDKDIMKELLEDDKLKEYILDNEIKIGSRYLKVISKDIEEVERIKELKIKEKLKIKEERKEDWKIKELKRKEEELILKSQIIIERRTLTITSLNALISFNKKSLLISGLEAGEYNVVYEEGKITIVKELKLVVI